MDAAAADAAGLAALTATALAVAGCGTDANGGGSSSSGSSSATIQVWEGWTGQEAKPYAHLVSEYEAPHPGQKVGHLSGSRRAVNRCLVNP